MKRLVLDAGPLIALVSKQDNNPTYFISKILNNSNQLKLQISTIIMTKKALITGLTGQDGSYLAELLLEKGYQVYGLVRRSSTSNLVRINHFADNINIISGDLLDQPSLMDAIA